MSEKVFYNSKNLVGIGSVGIGTTSPSAPLHVQTNTTGGDPTTASAYIYNASTSTGAQSILGIRLGASTSATNNAYTSYDIAGYYGFSTGICGDVGVTTNRRFSIKNTWDFKGTECLTILNSTGNVGIGTTNPGSILHVAGGAAELRIDAITSGDPFIRLTQDGVSKSYIGFSRSGQYMYLGFGADAMRVYSGGTSPMIPRGAAGGIQYAYCDNNGTMLFTPQLANGTLSASGGIIVSSSDSRIKSNIVYYADTALPLIDKLKPARFTFNQDPGTQKIGFIAQDVEKVIPDAVDGKKYEFWWETNDDAEGTPKLDENGNLIFTDKPRYRGLDTTAILATAIKAIQELAAKNTDLETQLQTAQNDIDLLESRLAAIEALIGTNTSAETDTTSSGTRAEALLAQV